jgi:hypothetical protein
MKDLIRKANPMMPYGPVPELGNAAAIVQL